MSSHRPAPCFVGKGSTGNAPAPDLRITAGSPEIAPRRRLEPAHVLRGGDTWLLRYRSEPPA